MAIYNGHEVDKIMPQLNLPQEGPELIAEQVKSWWETLSTSVPADEALLNLPIRENLTLTVAETKEEFNLSADGAENLAPLGMPGVIAAETSPLPDLNEAQVRLEIRQTYKLPPFFFDAVAKAVEISAPSPRGNYPGPARTSPSP